MQAFIYIDIRQFNYFILLLTADPGPMMPNWEISASILSGRENITFQTPWEEPHCGADWISGHKVSIVFSSLHCRIFIDLKALSY